MHDDDDDRDPSKPFSLRTIDPTAEIDEVMDDLERLLKNGDVIGALTQRGVNASIAMLAIDGIRAYLVGDKSQAADDLGAAADEIRGRLVNAALAKEPLS